MDCVTKALKYFLNTQPHPSPPYHSVIAHTGKCLQVIIFSARLSFLYIFQMQWLKNTHIKSLRMYVGSTQSWAPNFRCNQCYPLTCWLWSFILPHYSWVMRQSWDWSWTKGNHTEVLFLYVKLFTIKGSSESQFNLASSELRFLHFKDWAKSANFKVSSTL